MVAASSLLSIATPMILTEENSITPPEDVGTPEEAITPDEEQKWAPWSQAKISKKQAWTAAEDDKLLALIETHGPGRWSMIADLLNSDRIGKQCRERWCNHLSPAVKKEGFTADEDRLIVEAVAAHGTKWSAIVKLIPGRTDNAIKNRWNSCIRRMTREQRREGSCPLGPGDLAAMDPAELARQLLTSGRHGDVMATPAPSPARRKLLPDATGAAHDTTHSNASGAQQAPQGLHLLSHLSVGAQEAPASPRIVAAALSLGCLTSLSGIGAPRPRPKRRKRDVEPRLATNEADEADEAATKRRRSPLQPLELAVQLATSAEMHGKPASPRTMDAAVSLLGAL